MTDGHAMVSWDRMGLTEPGIKRTAQAPHWTLEARPQTERVEPAELGPTACPSQKRMIPCSMSFDPRKKWFAFHRHEANPGSL